ncbi:MAG: hypothetical protein E7564_01945 [Ruminococcaceae bacterium]|nr:hypothetical protein [Oscillospiraceae bacterium]
MKNHKSYKLKLLSLFLVFVLILSACGSNPSVSEESSKPDESVSQISSENENETNSDTVKEETIITDILNLLDEAPEGLCAVNTPEKIIITSREADVSGDLALSTLQGLASKHSKTQFIIKNGDGFDFMLSKINEKWNIETADNINGNTPDLKNLAKFYFDEEVVTQYILCKSEKESDSWYVAASLSGIMNAVAVPESLEGIFKDIGYTCCFDARELDDGWLKKCEYFSLINKDIALEQMAEYAPHLIDLAVKNGAYVGFSDSDNKKLHTYKYEFLNDNALVFGYNNKLGELGTVETLSKLNACLVPADWACNLSVLSNLNLEKLDQGDTVFDKEDYEAPENVHTVCLLMSDGDNMQWFLNDFTKAGGRWYGSDVRGQFPIGWGVPATSIDMCAPMLKYVYDEKTENDEFIMQLSGLGYTFPSRWNEEALAEMTEDLASYMERSDLEYIEILDNNGFGNDEKLANFTEHDEIEGIFYIDYVDYTLCSGDIKFSNGKPVVSAKHTIWNNFFGGNKGNIETVAEAVNGYSTDIKSEEAYTFIIVHCWSGVDENGNLVPNGDTMKGLEQFASLLDEDVELVTPGEFMERIEENLGE